MNYQDQHDDNDNQLISSRIRHLISTQNANADDHELDKPNTYALSILNPALGAQRYPDGCQRPTSLIETTTDYQYTVDQSTVYENDLMIIDTPNSHIVTPQLFRKLKGQDAYVHIADIPNSRSLSDGSIFGPIRRVSSEFSIQPLGLGTDQYGHRGLITCIDAGTYPAMILSKPKEQVMQVAGVNGSILANTPLEDGAVILQYPGKKGPFCNYSGFKVGADGINTPSVMSRETLSIAYTVASHPELYETSNILEWFRISADPSDDKFNEEFQQWNQLGQTYRITATWSGICTTSSIVVRWKHYRDFGILESHNEARVGGITTDTNQENFNFVQEITVPATLEELSIVFVGSAPTQTAFGNVIIEQLNYHEETTSNVVYITDMHDGQTLNFSGKHNYEYQPAAPLADVARPERHDPFEENALEHVVRMFDRLKRGGVGPAFTHKQRSAISALMQSQLLTRRGIVQYRASTMTGVLAFLKEVLRSYATKYAPAAARSIRDVALGKYDFKNSEPIFGGVENTLRRFRASTDEKDSKGSPSQPNNYRSGTSCAGCLDNIKEAQVTVEITPMNHLALGVAFTLNGQTGEKLTGNVPERQDETQQDTSGDVLETPHVLDIQSTQEMDACADTMRLQHEATLTSSFACSEAKLDISTQTAEEEKQSETDHQGQQESVCETEEVKSKQNINPEHRVSTEIQCSTTPISEAQSYEEVSRSIYDESDHAALIRAVEENKMTMEEDDTPCFVDTTEELIESVAETSLEEVCESDTGWEQPGELSQTPQLTLDDSICGQPITEPRVLGKSDRGRQLRKLTFNSGHMSILKASTDTKRVRRLNTQSILAADLMQVYQPMDRDTHTCIAKGLNGYDANWQVSRNFVAVSGDQKGVLCRAIITSRNTPGTDFKVGATAIKVKGFAEITQGVDHQNWKEALGSTENAEQRIIALVKEMETLESIGNIILYCEHEKDSTFDGLSMMAAIEACFNGYPDEYVYTGDSHPSTNWLPEYGLEENDLLAKIDYCKEKNYKLVIKDGGMSRAGSFSDQFFYPSKPLSQMQFPLFLEGYNPQLDGRIESKIEYIQDTAELLDSQSKVYELQEENAVLKDRVQQLEKALAQIQKTKPPTAEKKIRSKAYSALGFEAELPPNFGKLIDYLDKIKRPEMYEDKTYLPVEELRTFKEIVMDQTQNVKKNIGLYNQKVLAKINEAFQQNKQVNYSEARAWLTHLRLNHPALENAYYEEDGKKYNVNLFSLMNPTVTKGTVAFQSKQASALRSQLAVDKKSKGKRSVKEQAKTPFGGKADEPVDKDRKAVSIFGVDLMLGGKKTKEDKNQNARNFMSLLQNQDNGQVIEDRLYDKGEEDEYSNDEVAQEDMFATNPVEFLDNWA